MTTNITAWMKFALQQMAAESYLDGINLQNEAQVRLRLSNGNNDTRFIQADPITGELPGKTRFTTVRATASSPPTTLSTITPTTVRVSPRP